MFEPFTTASKITFADASVNNPKTKIFTTNSKLTFFILFGFKESVIAIRVQIYKCFLVMQQKK